MPTVTQDIFTLVLARPVTLPAGEHPRLVHLWWQCAPPGERLVQVYVNDALYDVTAYPSQRELWLLLDRSASHRIELLAVSADQAWVARPEALTSWQPRVHDAAHLNVLRDETLPVDTRLRVCLPNGSCDEGPMWPGDVPRGGFGAMFGEGAFGFDAIAGPGLGMGELGYGPLGADGSAWRWQRRDLSAGEHTLEITTKDRTGQTVAAPVMHDLSIEKLAEAATAVTVDGNFTLRWQ